MEEWSQAIKAYLEIGVLGLCAVTVVSIFWLGIKRSWNKDDNKDKKMDQQESTINERLDNLLLTIQQQNQQYQEQQMRNTELLLQGVMQSVAKHELTPEEDIKLTKLSQEIDKHLQYILQKTNACRVALVQYHNGIKSINGQSFLKMSMTNEQVQLGVKPFIADFKDQFRSTLAFFVKELNEKGFCYIDNVEDMPQVDIGMYEFMSSRNIQAKYGIALKNTDDVVIGFICVEYLAREKADIKTIAALLNERRSAVETLLNL